jgi:C4-dicarboxylate-specific signal transduction histidine kinase
MINLIKNAVEAAAERGAVKVCWLSSHDIVRIEVSDEGPGLAQTDNLWVPFFTTKQGGTGLGLVISREIVENHGGEITLANRSDRSGCSAQISLRR